MKIVFLPQAQADLDEIKEPLLSGIRRATVVGQFRVVYKHTARAVLVCYIRHCRRD